MIRRRSVRAISLFVFILAIAAYPLLAAAQTTGGVITGTVVDAQGGVLPGVTVTVRNTASGVSRTAVTESDGKYRLPALDPGPYELKAELSGFNPVTIASLTVVIGAELTSNMTMQLLGVNESVTVTGEAPIVETRKTDVSQVITAQQIESLPLATRQPVALALLMPGTSQDAVRPRKFNANLGAGAITNAGALLVDGVWNKEPCVGEPRQNFPQSTIQEFKVNVAQSTAEYGWTSSGVVSIVTKSGTNLFSGEAFEYFRDSSLNRMNKFEQLAHDTKGSPKPAYRRNQYGGAIGGPIIQNKLHFFFSAEGLKEQKYLTVNSGKPQFYGGLEGTFAVPEYDNTPLFVRADYALNQNNNIFVRHAIERADYQSDSTGGQSAYFSSNGIAQNRHQVVGGWTWIVNSHALNDLRLQEAYYGFFSHPPGVKPTFTVDGYPAARVNPLTAVYNFPSFTWGTNANLYDVMSVREVRDDFSLTTGSHSWKFGGAITNLPNYDDVASAPYGTWTFATDQVFDGTAATLANLKNPIQFSGAAFGHIDRDTPSQYNEAYAQDEWKPRSNVTFNLGVRYDLQTEIWNKKLNLNDKSFFPTTGTPTQIPYVDFAHRGNPTNVGPRLGLAWDVSGNGNSVVRAGWGIYYNPLFSTLARGEQTNFRQTAIAPITNPTYPDPYGGKDPLTFASTAPSNISILANNLKNPRSYASTVGFSQALSRTVAIHVDGVYNHTDRVPMTFDLNNRPGAFSPTTLAFVASGARLLPQFARIQQVQSIGYVNYKALLVRFEKQYDKRMQYLVSYTLASTRGNVGYTGPSGGITQAENPGLDVGPANSDRRHTLVSSGSFLLPGDVQIGAVWTLRSSNPWTAVAGRDLNGDGSITDFVPGTSRSVFNRGNNDQLMGLVNQWRAVLGLAPIPVSQLESNRYNAVDMRVTRTFRMGGTRKVDLIGQVFNVFGTNNLIASGGTGGWTTNATSDLFGRILQAFNRQQAELAVRFGW